MKMDRSNDAIFNSTTSIIKELTKLKNSCDQNGTWSQLVATILKRFFFNFFYTFKFLETPELMIEQARTVAIACKTLENEVKIFSEGISEEISREIDLEKRSVFAELKQVVSQLNNVKNFDGTRVS